MKKNSFVEGTIVAYISILLTKVLGAIYVIPFYKIIGETGGVLYGYAYNIYGLFLNISTSGIPTAIAIIISEYNALKMFNEREYSYKIANKVLAIISVFAFLIMFIFAKSLALFFIGNLDGANSIESVVLVIRVISFCLLIVPFLSVTRGYLQGNKYFSISSFSQLLEQVIRIFIVLVGSYIAINLLKYDISIGVSVALSGTVISALLTFLFLKYKIHKNKNELLKDVKQKEKVKVSEKDVIKKIFIHALPLIIISISQNLYEMVDLKLIIKGLYSIGFSAKECELIGSIVVTWASKICMVINAIALGLCASIIPFIVEGFVKKDNKMMNEKFNQSLKTILLVGIPIAVFMIAFNKYVYYIFYGNSLYGGTVLSMMSIVSLSFSIYLVINMILQGMKKYKLVYISTISGLVINALLDIPLITLLNRINFYPYLGTLFASLIGQTISISIPLYILKKEHNFKYKDILTNLLKMILPLTCMIIVIIIFKSLIKFDGSYFIRLIKLIITGIISMGTFITISYKNGLLKEVLGEDFINKILRKLRIKRGE